MPRISPQAIIFDMDGLMVDSEGRQSLAIEALLREHGTEPILKENTGIVHIAGMRAEDNLKRLKDQHDLAPSVADLHQRKNEIYRMDLEKGIDPMPGLLDLLAELKKLPLKKALASGSSKDDIQLILKHLKLENYFNAIVSGYEVKLGKPAPDIFLAAAERLGVDPQSAIVLEDAGVGIAAAKAAGMKAVAVPNRYSRDQDFSGADLTIDTLKELNWQKLQALY